MSTTMRSGATPRDPGAERARAIWSAGDFGRIAVAYAPDAADFVRRLGLRPGERVLDAACGTGNMTIPAARTGAVVTGLDVAPNLLAQARAAADAEALAVTLDEGDCQALPYADGAFDTVITMFGAMFAASPERTAAELLRVCRPGGRLVMANWTPTGFVGEMLKIVRAYAPPPAGIPSPALWGEDAVVRERLAAASALRLTRRVLTLTFPEAPAGVVELFRTCYGPTKLAFDGLEPERQARLRADLTALWSDHNRATDGSTRVTSEYLEVVARV